ncbi:MAG: hypothetical protein V3R88_05850, partial [Alphaproteobacteria bacterium]
MPVKEVVHGNGLCSAAEGAKRRDAPVASHELTGSEILIKALLDQGVDIVFGYPGGAVLPIYDA